MSSTLDWAWYALAALLAAGGVALGGFALFRDRSRGRRRCPKCWYSMEGVPGTICPECGKDAGRERRLMRTRRRWGRAACAALLALTACGCWAVPSWQRGGWLALVPSTVLVEVANFSLYTSRGSASTAFFSSGLGRTPRSSYQASTKMQLLLDTEVMARLDAKQLWDWQARRLFTRSFRDAGQTPANLVEAPPRWPRGRAMPFRFVDVWNPDVAEYRRGKDTWKSCTSDSPCMAEATSDGQMVIPVRYRWQDRVVLEVQARPPVELVDRAEELFENASGPQWNDKARAELSPRLVNHEEWRLRVTGPLGRRKANGDTSPGPIYGCEVDVVQDGRVIATGTNTSIWTMEYWDGVVVTKLKWAGGSPVSIDPAKVALRVRGTGEAALRYWERKCLGATSLPVAWFSEFECPAIPAEAPK